MRRPSFLTTSYDIDPREAGAALRAARKVAKLSLKVMAGEMGMDYSNLGKAEREGDKYPGLVVNGLNFLAQHKLNEHGLGKLTDEARLVVHIPNVLNFAVDLVREEVRGPRRELAVRVFEEHGLTVSTDEPGWVVVRKAPSGKGPLTDLAYLSLDTLYVNMQEEGDKRFRWQAFQRMIRWSHEAWFEWIAKKLAGTPKSST